MARLIWIGACCALFQVVVARRNLAPNPDAVISNPSPSLAKAGVKFNSQWFEDSCNLEDYKTPLFLTADYQLSEHEDADDQKWKEGFKCEDLGNGLDPSYFSGTHKRYDCAKICDGMSTQNSGKVICCEYHQDKKMCEVRTGWQSMGESDYGTFLLNPKNWMRNPKVARLFFTPIKEDQSYVPLQEGEEFTRAEQGRDYMKDVVKQVNHMSIDGILDHMLSFYVCMRWVPDNEFIKVSMFELENIAVDAKTGVRQVSGREEIIEEYLRSGLIPLRCGSAIHVKETGTIQELVDNLKNGTSDISDVARFSERVQKAGFNKLSSMKTRVAKVNEEMYWNESTDGNSVNVQDMINKARNPGVFPWSTLVRPSKEFNHHVSQPDNLFMICFGPRVASYPHKRHGGDHFLADSNMAGCNGFWDLPALTEHMERIKKLFAPEQCFEHELRKELKGQFLSTFVSMNEEFEQAMAGNYAKRLHDLDPAKSKKLDLLSERKTNFSNVDALGSRKINSKYTRFAQLFAKAHSKWIVCDSKSHIKDQAFGHEDNFFRDPKAYEKWLGPQSDDTTPECKTLDEATGCVRCAIAVKDEHSCHVRLNVKMKDIYKAIKVRKYPFLQSTYHEQVAVETEHGQELQIKSRRGACLVRKSAASAQQHAEAGLEAIKKAFFQVNNQDYVVRLNIDDVPDAGDYVESKFGFTVKQRKDKLEEWMKQGGNLTENGFAELINSISEETYRDKAEDFAKKFIYTQEIPKLQNRPAHKVDYFVSCPCNKADFVPTEIFQAIGSQGMAEYFNR